MRWLAGLLVVAGCATPEPQPPPDAAIETLKKQLDEARDELLLAKAAFERERDALRAEVRSLEGAFDIGKRSIAESKCKEYYHAANNWEMITKKAPNSLKDMEAPLSPGEVNFIRVENVVLAATAFTIRRHLVEAGNEPTYSSHSPP